MDSSNDMSIHVHSSQKTFICSMLPIKDCPSPFSPPQVVEYLQTIGFRPIPSWTANKTWENIEPNIETLEKLMRLHVIAFPFENTEDH